MTATVVFAESVKITAISYFTVVGTLGMGLHSLTELPLWYKRAPVMIAETMEKRGLDCKFVGVLGRKTGTTPGPRIGPLKRSRAGDIESGKKQQHELSEKTGLKTLPPSPT